MWPEQPSYNNPIVVFKKDYSECGKWEFGLQTGEKQQILFQAEINSHFHFPYSIRIVCFFHFTTFELRQKSFYDESVNHLLVMQQRLACVGCGLTA